jgi:hypothetical protein
MYQCDNDSGAVVCHRPWAAQGSGATGNYLGWKFHVNGKIHFGWARVQRENFQMLLTGYAYETIPGKAIITGMTKGPDESSVASPNESVATPTSGSRTLGILALGARALSIWRREDLASPKCQAN